MNLLSNSQEFRDHFERLAKYYQEWYWAVAWGSQNSIYFKVISKKLERAKCLIFGLYDTFRRPVTRPEFIQDLKGKPNIYFVAPQRGIFHPKIYLFWNRESDWECLIGSHNFTESALKDNFEASILFKHSDNKELGRIIRKYIMDLPLVLKDSIVNVNNEFLIEYNQNFQNFRNRFKNLKDDTYEESTDKERHENINELTETTSKWPKDVYSRRMWIVWAREQTQKEFDARQDYRMVNKEKWQICRLKKKQDFDRGDIFITYIGEKIKEFMEISEVMSDIGDYIETDKTRTLGFPFCIWIRVFCKLNNGLKLDDALKSKLNWQGGNKPNFERMWNYLYSCKSNETKVLIDEMKKLANQK